MSSIEVLETDADFHFDNFERLGRHRQLSHTMANRQSYRDSGT